MNDIGRTTSIEWLQRYVAADGDALCPRCRSPLDAAKLPRCPRCASDLQLSLGTSAPYNRLWGMCVAVQAAGVGVGAFLLLLTFFVPRIGRNGGWIFVPVAIGGLLAAGLAAALLRRRRFRQWSRARQAGALIVSVVLTVIVFIAFIAAFW